VAPLQTTVQPRPTPIEQLVEPGPPLLQVGAGLVAFATQLQ